MRFYGREEELAVLRDASRLSAEASQLTVVLGRRRVGKTTLMLKGAEGFKTIYLFISRLSEPVLCARLQAVASEAGVEVAGRIERFDELLRALMIHSIHEPLTVILDEFQNLEYVRGSVFGDIQNVWDSLKDRARIHLVVGGSVHSMMVRIFEDRREPLFGRATRKLEVRPFPTRTLGAVLRDHDPGSGNRDLLTLYMLTGGVPSYVALLMDAGATRSEGMVRFALSPGSTFLREGNDLMTEEFGKDNKVYLSILELVASGRTRRPELEDVLGKSIGEYLRRLEDEYGFIRREVPMLTGDTRLARWAVSDMYLMFYFRYVQPNMSYIEAGRTDLLLSAVERDLPGYEGWVLERYLRAKISEEWTYTEVGSFWNRRGDVEVDIVVRDSTAGTLDLIEVERDPAKLDMAVLRRKAEAISDLTRGYEVRLSGMSMDDMRGPRDPRFMRSGPLPR